ncbi:MAG: glycosyltransferase [Rubellimicrobium sp.]|nr:glycosyltransferase [Rubellimicrobium sp.]
MRKALRRFLPVLSERRQGPPATPSGPGTQEIAPLLDCDHYTRVNHDVRDAGLDPAWHFLHHGLAEGRVPNPYFSARYVHSHLDRLTLSGQTEVLAYARSDLARKPRLIFTSHDATRTGAPAIILRLLEMFSRSGRFECFSILDRGGERLSEFQALSHTYQMKTSRRRKPWSEEYAFPELQAHFAPGGLFHANRPVCALVNSAECFQIGKALADIGLPVLSLVHEVAGYYPPEVFSSIVARSRRTVFPSHFVSRTAASHAAIDLSRTTVRGQGVLEQDFGTLDRDRCRRLLREALGLADDALIVLGVGTVNIRKGADLFLEAARLFLEQHGQDRPVHFVWYGARGSREGGFAHLDRLLERHDLGDRVRFLPATAEIEQVFLGGDLFLLTARADPFPCVVHEAMACGLPVIAFRNGGGAPELIGDTCGTILEMGDLAAVAAAIRRYADEPGLRDWQGAAARNRIRRDWSFEAYRDDIYAILQEVVGTPPPGGWPTLPDVLPEKHLVVMRGCLTDLGLLDRLRGDMDLDDALVILIDGRFGAEADAVLAGLTERCLRVRVCQPVAAGPDALRDGLSVLLRNPKPGRLTLINTLGLLKWQQLGPLSFPVRAIVTDDAITDRETYRMIPFLERLDLSDPDRAARQWALNPRSREVVFTLPESPAPEPKDDP